MIVIVYRESAPFRIVHSGQLISEPYVISKFLQQIDAKSRAALSHVAWVPRSILSFETKLYHCLS